MLKNKEFKNFVGDVVKKLVNFFNLDSFKITLDNFLKKQYYEGIEKTEVQFGINFIPEEEESINFLSEYAFRNMSNVTDQIGADLRQEISRSILDGESKKEMVMRIKGLFAERNYTDRLKMVLRTEGMRAGNLGVMRVAEQSGLSVYKYLDVVIDDRTSEICKAEHKKYGDVSKAIPLGAPFSLNVKIGKKIKKISENQAPFHPNCRTSVITVLEEDLL